MKTSSAKNKGRRLQKWASKLIEDVFMLDEGDVESRPMGSGGSDVMMSARARKVFPFSVECKNTKKFPSLSALRQSQENKWGGLASVVWKPPGKNEEDSIIYFNTREFVEFWNKEKHAKKTK
jgi:hypothetical protein